LNALLLAGGYGTRLRPLTDTTPKCLMPVGGKPLLQIWLERLDQAGFNNFVINTHYLAQQVEEFVKKSPWRRRIRLAYEENLLGTAGTLVKHQHFFGGSDGLLVHADNLCLADFGDFIGAHRNRPTGTWITMMAFRTEEPKSCGIIEIDGQGVMRGFYEKKANPPSNLANAAVYFLSPEFINQLRLRWMSAIDFSTEILPMLGGRAFVWETKDPLIDIGTPKNYEFACNIFNNLKR
jgi:mannose-1-phosphate guanylyltransferase